ncbi:MAG: hypothetical protein IJ489_03815 [Clostridia bacterium]|nr:hypothetical protein [Clostridia bacterium]
MTNLKSTRRALFTSIIAFVLCFSMLLGTTYAWFTDSVTSSGNIIKTGTLDITMAYADGTEDPAAADWKDAENATIFNYENWEPGYVNAKHIKIENKGSLALKYQMRIISEGIVSELADVIDVYYFETAQQLNARTTLENATKLGTLTELLGTDGNLSKTVEGTLEAGEEVTPKMVTFAFKMQETAGNEYQNLSVSDEGFTIQLIATQLASESDSFDNQYDANVPNPAIPAALVRPLEDTTVMVTAGIGGGNAAEMELDAAYKFEPTISDEDVLNSEYKYYHADFYVYADKAIPADSIALAGYYSVWCDGCNKGNWVALTNADTPFAANEGIRLVQAMGNGGIEVTYKDICDYGNDGKGFQCGLKALKPEELEGTTVTVELCIYETDVEWNASTHGDCTESGEYITIGTFTHTFPGYEVSSLTELDAAIKAGHKVIDAKGANLGDFYYDAKFTDGVVIQNAKFSYFYGGNVEGTVTFENCEFVSDHSYSANFDSGNGKVIFNNCLFDGWSSFGTAITGVEMNNCTFQKTYLYGVLRFYQDAALNNCTFADSFEGVDSNVTGTEVHFNNCTGIDSKIYNNGDNVGTWIVDGVDISDTVTAW